jgi:hypothetical protein
MLERDRIKIVVREWVKKAENDFRIASHILKIGAECPTDIVCLVLLIPEAVRPRFSHEEQQRLTGYATITRYPGDYEPVTMKEARVTVRLARRIRSIVRKRLPASTLKN